MIAPTTKSSWSIMGNIPPGGIFILLLIKVAVKSPKSAPKGVSIAKRIGNSKK